MTSEPTPTVICDAGPLIHLDEIGCLSLLNDVPAVLVPDQVWQEVARHRPRALVKPSRRFQSVDVTISSEPTFQTLVQSLSLDIGEQASCHRLLPRSILPYTHDCVVPANAASTQKGTALFCRISRVTKIVQDMRSFSHPVCGFL